VVGKASPVDSGHCLGTNHPGVVAGRYHANIPGPDVELTPIRPVVWYAKWADWQSSVAATGLT